MYLYLLLNQTDQFAHKIQDLKENQRPEILRVVQWARSLGDLSENADYSAAKEKQRQIDKRIQYIESVIENSQVIDVDSLSGNRVVSLIGCYLYYLGLDVSIAALLHFSFEYCRISWPRP